MLDQQRFWPSSLIAAGLDPPHSRGDMAASRDAAVDIPLPPPKKSAPRLETRFSLSYLFIAIDQRPFPISAFPSLVNLKLVPSST